MTDCIFCKIVQGNIPSVKWHEDEDFITILDINPNTQGASLMISKQHQPSDFAEAEDYVLQRATTAIKAPINKLKRLFKTSRVGVVVEGVGVNHLHFKLYPLVNYEQGVSEAEDRVYFDTYPGYLTTKLGPKAETEDLRELGNKLAVT